MEQENNESESQLTPRIAFPIKEINFSSDIHKLETLEYVRIGAFNHPLNNTFEYKYGFFGKKFLADGEVYFTLLDAMPSQNPNEISLTSNLYKISLPPAFHISNKLKKQVSNTPNNTESLEDVINDHATLFKEEIIINNFKMKHPQRK